MNESILIVDDEPEIRHFIKDFLLNEGFDVTEAENGQIALNVLDQKNIDLVIVDIMMPTMDGYELCEEIRRYYDIPVLMVTAKDQLQDKTKGFLAGTDDYVTKPFEPKELHFRIKALLRRFQKDKLEQLTVGHMVINRKSYEVEINGAILMLPLKEFELLAFLASQPSRTYSRDQLIEHVWGIDFEGDERTVDVHIKRLRERFKNKSTGIKINTVRSVGYKLEVLS